jgi:Uma2 family endonuclease
MMEAVRTMPVTQADLLRLEAMGKHVEVDDGAIIESEIGMAWLHLLVIQTLFLKLYTFVIAHELGMVYMDGGRYRLKGSPNKVERAYMPDLSFVQNGRFPSDFDWEATDAPLAPDLAVEVMSPGQTNRQIMAKVAGYFEAGTSEVWVIYPKQKSLHQYFADEQAPRAYANDDEVTSPLFAGLAFKVADLFVKPTA